MINAKDKASEMFHDAALRAMKCAVDQNFGWYIAATCELLHNEGLSEQNIFPATLGFLIGCEISQPGVLAKVMENEKKRGDDLLDSMVGPGEDLGEGIRAY